MPASNSASTLVIQIISKRAVAVNPVNIACRERERMSNDTLQSDSTHRSEEVYVIRIKGHLSPAWSEVFEGMRLSLTERGETLITGFVADQAALHGLLARIRDLNLTLISVTRGKPERSSRSRTKRSKE
jgi:hypothetical protein